MSAPEFDPDDLVGNITIDPETEEVTVEAFYEKHNVGLTVVGYGPTLDQAWDVTKAEAKKVFDRHVEAFSIQSDETFDNIASDDGLHVAFSINELRDRCYDASAKAGWWDAPLTKETVPVKLMLTVSELAEAMEAHRKDLMDDHILSRKGLEVELADALIRILDLAGRLELDIGGAFIDKMAYNAQRADHKRENRAQAGGKAY